MPNHASKTQPIFPIRGQALDIIKILAAIFMLIDHFDAIILGRTSVVMELIGRGAFPLFCYATAAYLMRGGDAGRYTASLLAFGVIVQPVYAVSLYPNPDDPAVANVLFSLAAGCAVAAILQKCPKHYAHGVFVIGILDAINPSFMDFGLTGACLPAAMLFALKGEKQFIPWLLGLLFFLNAGPEPGSFTDPQILMASAILFGFIAMIMFVSFLTAKNFRGNGRLLHRYALHIFYPGHLALLALAKMVI